MPRSDLGRDGLLALIALACVFWVTVGWWSLALWPAPGVTPEWLERARAVCFNAGPDGMPDVSGWLLLVGQPLGMFGFLGVVWSGALSKGLGWLWSRGSGRLVLAGFALLALGGLAGAGVRVAAAADARAAPIEIVDWMAAEEHPRLALPAPELGLVNQRGERIETGGLLGRPLVVTFAFGHCPDICPLVVHNALVARDAAWGPDGGSVVVVTLDPWRDTPSRLPALGERWGLGAEDHVLSGTVESVEAVLDAWSVRRERDLQTGDVLHPSLTYLVDARGTIVFATLGGAATLEGLAERF